LTLDDVDDDFEVELGTFDLELLSRPFDCFTGEERKLDDFTS
jgi:hypothetical protein